MKCFLIIYNSFYGKLNNNNNNLIGETSLFWKMKHVLIRGFTYDRKVQRLRAIKVF